MNKLIEWKISHGSFTGIEVNLERRHPEEQAQRVAAQRDGERRAQEEADMRSVERWDQAERRVRERERGDGHRGNATGATGGGQERC